MVCVMLSHIVWTEKSQLKYLIERFKFDSVILTYQISWKSPIFFVQRGFWKFERKYLLSGGKGYCCKSDMPLHSSFNPF